MKGSTWAIIIVAIVVVIAIILAVVYYNPSSTGNVVTPTNPNVQPAATLSVVMASNSNLGSIMTGLNGMSLYIFKADTNGQSACYGTCASVWPPLIVDDGVVPQGDGIDANLGVIERTDGTYQVTANGMPLYYYAGDSNPGDTNGQGLLASGALWYVISPSGQVITSSANSSTSSTSGGGY